MEIKYSSDNTRQKGHDYIYVDGAKYICSEKLQKKLSYCTNDKEYSEMMEFIAQQVFLEKTQENDGLFY